MVLSAGAGPEHFLVGATINLGGMPVVLFMSSFHANSTEVGKTFFVLIVPSPEASHCKKVLTCRCIFNVVTAISM